MLFEDTRKQWDTSETCEAVASLLRNLISGNETAKKVTKVLCFGLGDINRKPPDWWRIENDSQPKDKQVAETSIVEGALMHHAIALTVADVARSCAQTADAGVRLLTQDPDYSDETKHMLLEIGFEVVGEHGAGGFAELDDESVVFSPFPSVPVKQIIADLARPAAIICAANSSAAVFNSYQYVFKVLIASPQLIGLGSHTQTQNLQGRDRCGRTTKAGTSQLHRRPSNSQACSINW